MNKVYKHYPSRYRNIIVSFSFVFNIRVHRVNRCIIIIKRDSVVDWRRLYAFLMGV